MYEQHWNLSQRPFENRADAEFYYPAETHQAALMKLHYAIENRRAAAVLCGPGGIGKSLVIDGLRRQLPKEFTPFCHIAFPAMESEQLVRYLVDQLAPPENQAPRTVSDDLLRFEKFLRDCGQAGKHPVVVVDEAHLLEQFDALEPLRLLLNIATDDAQGETAWTLVLAGQPTVLSHVERYHALDGRLAVKCMLNRLLPEESIAYIQHRMRLADVDAEKVFDNAALEKIHLLSQGIPRQINRLCDLALMVGFAEERTIIGSETVENVHSDLAVPTIV